MLAHYNRKKPSCMIHVHQSFYTLKTVPWYAPEKDAQGVTVFDVDGQMRVIDIYGDDSSPRNFQAEGDVTWALLFG